MTTTAVAWAALAIAVVAAICAALTYRLVTVDRHEIDLLRDRADKTDDRAAQLRTDIDATRDWTWDHHDAHGWGEEAAPVHPATQAIPVVGRPSPTPSAPLQAPQAHAQGHEETPEAPPAPQNGAQGDYGAPAQDRRPSPGPRHGSEERMTRSERRKIREGNDA